MEIENQIMPNILSTNITKEIESLPKEFKEKSEEVKLLQNELNNLRSKYTEKEKQISKISKDIMDIENYLTSNLEEISKIKTSQKLIIDSLNEEYFKIFTQSFYKIPNNYQELILVFLKYEGNLKNELNFLLSKKENLHQLLRDSYSYYKSIEEIDKEKYELCKDKIKNYENGENVNIGNKKTYHKSKVMQPFSIIINFIENTFRIIEINKNNKEIHKNIIDKSTYKQKLFIENLLLKEEIKEKQEQLKNINIYIKHINNILIKYKNFFGNSNINKNNKPNNSKSISTHQNENGDSNNILLENKSINNISDVNNLNNKINNNNIFFNSNINNEKYKNNINDKIILKSNNKIKNDNKNLELVENNNNNFYHAFSNFKKKSSISSMDSSSSVINSINNINNINNIKIISIITSSNKSIDNQNISNSINDNKNKINSNSLDYSNKNQRNLINTYSAKNQKEGKRIKIGSLSMYQSSTSKKYKNKIIKTNSFEQVESRKIFINKPISNNETNKSYTEKVDYIMDENKDKNTNFNKNQEKQNINMINENKQIYYSYQIDDDRNKDNRKINKNINQIKSIKEENDKKDIRDNLNNNISEYKQNEINENARRKNFYLSPGIYNNNRKILKMFEMNKNNKEKK